VGITLTVVGTPANTVPIGGAIHAGKPEALRGSTAFCSTTALPVISMLVLTSPPRASGTSLPAVGLPYSSKHPCDLSSSTPRCVQRYVTFGFVAATGAAVVTSGGGDGAMLFTVTSSGASGADCADRCNFAKACCNSSGAICWSLVKDTIAAVASASAAARSSCNCCFFCVVAAAAAAAAAA